MAIVSAFRRNGRENVNNVQKSDKKAKAEAKS
jgi:hypothetical protein